MRFDYVIVGAGSAGCVLANRLSADPARTVCLIEAGGRDRSPLIHMPAGVLGIVPTRHANWAFETVPQPGLNGRRGYQPRGRTLGGSSSINAMIYIRGHRSDYDDWAALGNDGWSYADVLPYFKRSEDQQRGADEFHGQGGELTVSDLPDPVPASHVFVESAQALGIPANTDFNGAVAGGRGPVPGHAAQGPPLQRRGGVPAAGRRAPESHRPDALPCRAAAGSRWAHHRRAGRTRR